MFKNIKSLFLQIINFSGKTFLEIFVFDKQIRRILRGKWAKLFLKKYVKIGVRTPKKEFKKEEEYKIWQYWEQGIEQAPDIVRACLDSVEKYKGDTKRIILSEKNLSNYIEIPGYIYDKRKRGIIKSAHFSDIVRTYLLCEHGGCWADATVLFTDKLPDYIKESELFVFQNDLKVDLDGLNMASYFISAKPANKILLDTKDTINEYWKDNNFLANYFLFLHAFTMVTLANKENYKMFEQIPFTSFIPVQHFQKEILTKYDYKRWQQIKSTTSIHKLSYKPKNLGLNKISETKNSFYDKLLNGELINE